MSLNPSIATDSGKYAVGASGELVTAASDFVASTIAFGAESADIVAAPGAGFYIQLQFLMWTSTAAAALIFAVMSEPSGTPIFYARANASTAVIFPCLTGIRININTNKAFRIKNLDGAAALPIYLNYGYVILAA